MVTPGVKLKKSTFEKVCWGGSFCHSNWPRTLKSLEHEMISIFQLTTDHLNFHQHIGDILWFPWNAHVNEHLGSWLQVPKIDTDLTEEKTTTDTGAAMVSYGLYVMYILWKRKGMQVGVQNTWWRWRLYDSYSTYWLAFIDIGRSSYWLKGVWLLLEASRWRRRWWWGWQWLLF